MKRGRILATAFAVLVMCSQAWAGSSGITILSQQYHIWGGTYTGLGEVASYDQQGNLPLWAMITRQGPYPSLVVSAYSKADPFSVEADARGFPAGYEWAPPNTIEHDMYWGAEAAAEATVTFQPHLSGLQFSCYGGGDYLPPGGYRFSLVDLTADRTILEFPDGPIMSYFAIDVPPDWLCVEADGNSPFRFDPSHIYRINLYVNTGGSWGETSPCGIIATIEQAPAPGAALLGSLGAGLIGWLRRRGAL